MLSENKPLDTSRGKTKRIDEIKKKSIVRTYESDVSIAIKKKKTSMVDIMMIERKAKKKQQEKSKTEPKRQIDKDKLLKIGIIGLIVVAILFLGYGIYTIFSRESFEGGIKVSDLNEVVFVNERISLDITGLDKRRVISKILDIKDELDPTLGTIVNIYPIKEVVLETEEEIFSQKIMINTSDFLQNIGIILPSILERTLTNEFMFGFHMTGMVEPFFVFKVDSFENAFAGMLKWEKDIDNDLEFLIEERLRRSMVIHATSSEEIIGLLKPFEDIIIKNRDVRVMKDKNNEDILMYSLPDRKTIIITTNENTLIEIFDRLARVKFSR